jgi:hypothetical protein
MGKSSCGCGSSSGAPLNELVHAAKPVTLSTKLTWRDILGGWGVRWGIGRMNYRVSPGLYRIGEPDSNSPVLVTANYKLTVDAVRRELAGVNVWVLILDTKGVNVWCAAGKGTFGTAELVCRIAATNLASVVNHRHLVLPQLGATGVAAHEVKRATGFLVHYGPVRARDIRPYLAAGMKATPDMRRVTFNWRDRIVVAPLELVGAIKPGLIILAALAVFDLIAHRRLTSHLALDFFPFLAAMLTGGLFIPLLLPFLPFRYFALKGAVAGAVLAALLLLLPMGRLEAAGVALLVLAITSYMAMMFTGATTFTTLAGVKLEVRRALPIIIGSAGVGAVLRVAAAFV